MKFAEKIVRVFEHKPIEKVIFQPRIRYWYKSNKVRTLKFRNYQKYAQWVPEEYRGKKITEIYDELKCIYSIPFRSISVQGASSWIQTWIKNFYLAKKTKKW